MPDKHFAESFLPINLNSIVAKTPVRAYAIHHEHFFEVIEDDPGLYKDLSISLTQNLSNVLEHSYWLASADASTRLCLMLANFMEEVEGVFAIPRCLTYQEMGNFLSIHSVTVAKIVKSLVNEGIVVRKGHTLLISDPERLRQIARKEFFPKY
jgi:CRP-like cAMP-binding protein